MMYTFVEVIRVSDGQFDNLSLHTERMSRTMVHFFGCDMSENIKKLTVPEGFRRGRVKCRIIYAKDIISVSYEHYKLREIRSAVLVKGDAVGYSFKYEDRSALEDLFGTRGDCDEVLIVKENFISDTSFSNVVFKSPDGKLYTPAQPLLAGTKRHKLLSQHLIEEKEITVSDIYGYEGFYIINAMIDIEDNVFVAKENIYR